MRSILPALFVLIGFAPGLTAQITNGGFENGSGGLPASWDSSHAGDALVLDQAQGGADLLMPFDGQRWLTFSAQGSVAAVPAGNPGGAGSPPQGARYVEQAFSIANGATHLAVTARFLSNEAQGSAWQDFLSVDVSDGSTWHNLVHLGVNDPFQGNSLRYASALNPNLGLAATALQSAAVDLPLIFPSAGPSTVFKLRLSVGNGLDGSLASRGYFDANLSSPGVAFPTPIQPVLAQWWPQPNGDQILVDLAPSHALAEFYNLFSATTSQPLGSGPLLGLTPDQATYEIISKPFGAQPFHHALDGAGGYAFSVPANLIPAGVVIDLVLVVLPGNGSLTWSAPVRHVF